MLACQSMRLSQLLAFQQKFVLKYLSSTLKAGPRSAIVLGTFVDSKIEVAALQSTVIVLDITETMSSAYVFSTINLVQDVTFAGSWRFYYFVVHPGYSILIPYMNFPVIDCNIGHWICIYQRSTAQLFLTA